MKKIHCEEAMKVGFDKVSLKEVRNMIGFYEPSEDFNKTGKWEVTMITGGYTAASQFEAEVIASLEEIKALILKRRIK